MNDDLSYNIAPGLSDKCKKKAGTPGPESPSEPVYVIPRLKSKLRYRRSLRLRHP